MSNAIKTFPDIAAVAQAFAVDFVALLNRLSQSQKSISVSLSGGSTPKLLFSVLANDFCSAVDWENVHFFWGDERCVAPTDPESNFGEADKRFLSKINIPAENIHRIHGENEPSAESLRYSQEIVKSVELNKNGTPRFDIMLLGMGDDGHTASIFPDAMAFLASENICEVATHPQSGQKRITITGQVINASANVFFLVTGAGKSDVLAEIINRTGNFAAYPAAHIAPESGATFYLDESAAARLETGSAAKNPDNSN